MELLEPFALDILHLALAQLLGDILASMALARRATASAADRFGQPADVTDGAVVHINVIVADYARLFTCRIVSWRKSGINGRNSY